MVGSKKLNLMKTLLTYISICSLFLCVSCTETDPITSETTTFTVFNTPDQTVGVWELNKPFIDESISATENGKPLDVIIDHSLLNIEQVGLYTVFYTAINSDGFSSSISKTVIIHDPNIVGSDISGNIRDKDAPDRKATISLVEGTKSIFFASDLAFGGIFPVYFQMNGDVISDIPQTYAFDFTKVDLTYNPTTKQFTSDLPELEDFPPYTFEYEN